MKTIKTLFEEEITLTGKEVFVTFTDKFLSGWECNGCKPHKQIYICKNKQEAFILIDRLASPKHGAKYVNYTYKLPYYSPNKYTSSFRVFDTKTDYNF